MDAGDTFVYGYPTFYEAVRDCWVALDDEVDDASIRRAAARFFAENPRTALTSQENFQTYFQSLYRSVLRELNFPGDVEEFVEFLWAEWESGRRLRLFDDARGALEMLHRARFKLGIVSNWDLSFEGVMERLGVLKYFDVAVCSCRVGAAKPDPRIFEYALEQAGASPSQAWFIGDQAEYDTDPAGALGMKTVLVDYYGKSKPDERGRADVFAPSISLAAAWILQDELGDFTSGAAAET